MELKSFQQLDFVLRIFKAESLISIETIIEEFKKNNETIDYDYADAMVRKLIEDGLVIPKPGSLPIGGREINFELYSISFKGKLFKGYENEINDSIAEARHAESIDTAIQANNKWMKYGSVGAAIIAFLYLLWDIIKFGLDHHWFAISYCHCQ